ncbi:Hypothetical protein NTJ_13485 [Nesidiocoris tenuis]|uniref:Uncharacterized protein n=1 Tax=Nesidiocoris tenuis TaxID=355587 RepID=A0ABN7B8R4_9HEMI|nr:Hypothetical protein NTJ_13485 [Nesidiocoris tenuis]
MSNDVLRFAMDDHKDEARFAWGAMGDLIESSGFFPVTINVPDMISNMYEAWHQMMDFMFGSVNESAPRILEFLKALDHDLPDLE